MEKWDDDTVKFVAALCEKKLFSVGREKEKGWENLLLLERVTGKRDDIREKIKNNV